MIRFVEPTSGPLAGIVFNHPTVGPLILVCDPSGAIVRVEWGSRLPDGLPAADESLSCLIQQNLDSASPINVSPRGLTPMQLDVIKTIATIQCGRVMSYGNLAKMINCHSVRAVATAVGHNPLPVLIPCHRVLPARGATLWADDPSRVLADSRLVGHYTPDDNLKVKLLSVEVRK